ncbi:hypothetical protein [Neorhizobium sp. NCHU2750]|nr:hypothetical protein NCHU2750_09530 [Neorhizobium sp. NCHU2750]
MSNTAKTDAPEAKPDFTAHYRPIGLKAVAAAAMMLKRKPKLSPIR